MEEVDVLILPNINREMLLYKAVSLFAHAEYGRSAARYVMSGGVALSIVIARSCL